MPKFIKKIQVSEERKSQIKEAVTRIPKPWKIFANLAMVLRIITFVLLLFVYLIHKLALWITRGFEPKWMTNLYLRIVSWFDISNHQTISRVDLIELSLRNMAAKKTRTMVTIGGMTLGIGAIVFLVSVGYGLQELVVSRVARLEEMKQVDVAPQPGSKATLDDKALSDFAGVSGVKKVLPLIAVVGQVNYQNSVSDMAVYGVTTDYLKQSDIKPVQGQFFENNELVSLSPESGVVAGAQTSRTVAELGATLRQVTIQIYPDAWVSVYESAKVGSTRLGFTKRIEGQIVGTELWGEGYGKDDTAVGKSGITPEGKIIGKWVKGSFLLWEEGCAPDDTENCFDGKYHVKQKMDLNQVENEGYVKEENVSLIDAGSAEGSVLGESTDSSIDWVEIASESSLALTPAIDMVTMPERAVKEAVVNRAMLKVLGLEENGVIGKTFDVSFVVVGELLDDPKNKIQSIPTPYKIVGVVPDEKTPIFYVPFVDLRSLGITKYSQMKLVIGDQNLLAKTRKTVEAMGYVTRSVADTVAQINALFGTARTVLAMLGMVALAVAALGMFNTLTVSLLERTREVGLMKAMGMKSSEVQELFLTESMIMGFVGGLVGILAGFMAGKLLGLLLSAFSMFKGVGYIDIAYLPMPFLIIVILLSLIVGLVTGMYPAKRATQISALNALRYE